MHYIQAGWNIWFGKAVSISAGDVVIITDNINIGYYTTLFNLINTMYGMNFQNCFGFMEIKFSLGSLWVFRQASKLSLLTVNCCNVYPKEDVD